MCQVQVLGCCAGGAVWGVINLLAMVPQMVMHVLYVSRHRVQNGVILMVG